jgi:hypothetical protein
VQLQDLEIERAAGCGKVGFWLGADWPRGSSHVMTVSQKKRNSQDGQAGKYEQLLCMKCSVLSAQNYIKLDFAGVESRDPNKSSSVSSFSDSSPQLSYLQLPFPGLCDLDLSLFLLGAISPLHLSINAPLTRSLQTLLFFSRNYLAPFNCPP